MGGDDSQKLRPWRGRYPLRGSANLRHALHTVTELPVDLPGASVPCPFCPPASVPANLDQSWRAGPAHSRKVPKGDRFTNIVHAHCEPAPSFTTGALTIRDTNIVVVNVPPGYDKPYTVKDQGTYVRVGATTRRANRYEMDRLYSSKQAPVWR